MSTDVLNVLFLCNSNRARSQLAEAIFREKARQQGLDQVVEVHSACLTEKEPIDHVVADYAKARDINLTGQRSKTLDAINVPCDFIIKLSEMKTASVEETLPLKGTPIREAVIPDPVIITRKLGSAADPQRIHKMLDDSRLPGSIV